MDSQHSRVIEVRNSLWLDVATYLGVAAMAIAGVSGLPSWPKQLLALGLCLVFSLLYWFLFQNGRYVNRPNLYFGLQLLVVSGLLLLESQTYESFIFLFFILTVQTAIALRGRMAAVWITLYFVVAAITLFAARGSEAIFAIFFDLIAFFISSMFGRLVQETEIARRRTQGLLEELERAQQQVQELAVVEERNRLARDLHDSVKQQVFATRMQLGAALASLDHDAPAYAYIVEAEHLSEQAGQELNTMIRALRPVTPDNKPTADALREQVAAWSRQNGIPAVVRVEGAAEVAPATKQALLKVAQEALANVARHSEATAVEVTFTHEPNGDRPVTTLTIHDNGRGFDAATITKGIGLDSMRERMEALGGRLNIQSGRNGTTVIATLDKEFLATNFR